MGKKRDISSFLKGQIIALQNEGYTERAISSRLQISKTAVHNAVVSGGSSRRCNNRRPRKTTPRDDRLIKHLVQLSPHISSVRVAQVAGERGINISSRTVRRRLTSEFHLVARRPAKKPLLTTKQLKARLQFCKAMKDKSAAWWEKVMFTDESTFQQIRSNGYNYVRRPKGERLNPRYTIKTVKHLPSVMVWGAISAMGRCGLHLFGKGEKVNAEKYIAVLESKVKVHMNASGTSIFQQDSAPCHTAKSVKKWFTDNNVHVLPDWPSSSPDLNVIENCWELMKKKVAAHRPTSEEDLKKILKTVWVTEITPSYCKTLVHSMPARIHAVIQNRGHPTKY